MLGRSRGKAENKTGGGPSGPVSEQFDTIAELIEGFELPSFPGVTAEALDMIGDPNANLRKVGEVISLDPGLAVEILRMVNSAAFGTTREITSVGQAITLLGGGAVESLLISRAIPGALPSPTASAFDAAKFWSTAAERATIAASLATSIDPSRKSESFTSALLQDMAVPVLVDRLNGYDDVVGSWMRGELESFCDVEQDRFGWTHASFAAWMCKEWQLPEGLSESIAHHHGDHEESPLIASRLVSEWDMSLDALDGRSQVTARIVEHTGRDEADIDTMVDSAIEEAESMAALFS